MDHPAKIVEISTPSRLHFGMFSFGRDEMRQFGGVGMMIDRPGVRLRCSPANAFHVHGLACERVEQFAANWAKNSGLRLPLVQIEIIAAPPQHSGLGVGTQLALATAAGLNAFTGRPRATGVELAALTERGLRSSVGIFGFDRGGLIIDHGKRSGERVASRVDRVEVPSAWRVVLIQPQQPAGLSGREEQLAFATAPPVSDAVTAALWQLADEMRSTLATTSFDRFADSLFRFGHTAGLCFAEIQGGAYNGLLLAEIVATAQRLGCRGVGQSSWGPTIFCLLRDQGQAAEFVEQMRRELSQLTATYTIAAPNNVGARIDVRS